MKGFSLTREGFRSPLARRLLVAIILVSSAITLCLTALQIYGEYRSELGDIQSVFRQIEEVHLKSLTQSLWETSEAELQLQIEGIVHVPNIEHIAVREGDRILAQAGRRASRKMIERQYPMIYPYRGRTLEIGTLTVVASLDAVYRELFNRAFIILASNALKTFLVAGFAFTFFHLLVNRHLLFIAKYLRGLDLRGRAPPLILARAAGRRHDELDEVAASINHLHENARSTVTALHDSESRLRLAVDSGGVGLWEWQIATGQLTWNNQLKIIFGLPLDVAEPTLETFLAAIHPEDLAETERVFRGALENHTEYNHEFRILRPDGAVRWIVTIARGIYDATNQPVQMLGAAMDISNGKQAEEKLRESEDRYRDLVEHSEDLICTHDLDGRILSVNPWAAKILGYKQAELVNMNLRDVLAPVVRHEFDGYLAAVRAQGASQGLMLVQSRTGVKRVWEYHNTLRTEGLPAPIVRGMAHDITERKQAERELTHKTELAQLLEQLARAANEAVSPEAAMETCLRRICENGKWVLGRVATFSPGLSLRKPDRSQWFCAEPARFDAFMRYSDGYQFMGGPSVFINVVLRAQRPVWLPDVTAPDMSRFFRLAMAAEAGLKAAFAFPVIVSGEVIAFLEFFATETRQPDALLIEGTTGLASQFARMIERGRAVEAQARLAAIVENSSDAIISRALDSTVTSWNPAAERILGYTAAEVIGRNPVEIIPPELRQEATEWRNLVKAGQTLQNIETVRIAKDGRHIDVAVSYATIKSNSGGIIGTATIVRDISERKRAERILHNYTARLQTVSRKLLEVQEDERRRLARELHDQVGQVLTALKINLQVIERQSAAAPVALKTEECMQLADAALQQVRTLMLDLRPPQLDELGLAVTLRAHARRAVAPANLALHFSAPAVPAKLPPEMEIVCFRIMQEALTNILRHAGASNVWVDLAITGDELRLTVRDDGKGFDLVEAQRRAIGGGSIGLLSMEERATLADGRIEISTAPGAGTTVRATFSLQAAQSTVATA